MVISLYRLTAEPAMIGVGPGKGELAYVTLRADRGDGLLRKLRIYESCLLDILGLLTDQKTAHQIILELRSGWAVEIPGVYPAATLCQMGFRKLPME